MKYVILQQENKGVIRVFPIIFPERLVHKSVAEHMIHLIGWDRGDIPTVRSAGFCDIDVNTAEFFARPDSESLGISANFDMDDEKILNMPEAMQGILI